MEETTNPIPSGFDPLALDNQVCFALYVCSKEIIKKYGPMLDPLNLTYTSYITLMSLWQKDGVTVKELGASLYLDSGTLTPLLKKMEAQNLITRTRSPQDERTVIVNLTQEGRDMKAKCSCIPQKMACSNILDLTTAKDLITILHKMMHSMTQDSNI